MANNNDNNRRDSNRPEDNPFVAFRRFADSQVSSLLNTVFTLPATIVNYNNAHQAREQCLFGKADPQKCDELRRLENRITDLQHNGREAFRDGDMQAVLRNSEEVLKADRLAEDIRRDILGVSAGTLRPQSSGSDNAELVERVANAKGQEWGWMWDWGFPRPFDHDNRGTFQSSAQEDMAQESQRIELMLRLQAEARRLGAEFNDKAWNDPEADVAKFNNYSESHEEDGKPRVWSWSRSWQWPPPPANASGSDDAYSPRALEQSPEMNKAGVPWRAAYEDLIRAEQDEQSHYMRSDAPQGWGRKKIPISQRQLEEAMERSSDPRCPSGMDEPNYEYSHDHEDQHDDPPTPKRQHFTFADDLTAEEVELVKRNVRDPEARKYLEAHQARTRGVMARLDHNAPAREEETEMDAYEQLDAATATTSIHRTTEEKPSVLSTLTTTERTVAPDGSVTTKVVLKKRFADGREESTETLHTQRGQENDKDPWKAVQAAANNMESKKKGSGWFWSN